VTGRIAGDDCGEPGKGALEVVVDDDVVELRPMRHIG
jgi:hypothetical protein